MRKRLTEKPTYLLILFFFFVFVFYSVVYGDLFEGTVQILEEVARSAVVVVRVMLVVVVWLVWLRCWVGGRLSVTFVMITGGSSHVVVVVGNVLKEGEGFLVLRIFVFLLGACVDGDLDCVAEATQY